MKRHHFSELKPICPVCQAQRPDQPSPLEIGSVYEETKTEILQGILLCSFRDCRREYPIIDGLPLIVADLRNFLAGNLLQVLQRQDLAEDLESLLTDACGPGSFYESPRQHLNAYTWDHYAEFDPQEADTSKALAGNVVRLMQTVLPQLTPDSGPILDVGCSVGRTTFELAQWAPDATVLGIDLNFGMLGIASNVLRQGVVRYPRRRLGVVYDRREFPVSFAGAPRVDFWACDASALPFAAHRFSLIQAMNVLDCLPAPWVTLQEFERNLTDHGHLWVTTPFDWNVSATAVEGWLGGHSQRGPGHGESVELLRSLFQPSDHPAASSTLHHVAEWLDLPWRVRCHDRSMMEYRSYGLLAQRQTA